MCPPNRSIARLADTSLAAAQHDIVGASDPHAELARCNRTAGALRDGPCIHQANDGRAGTDGLIDRQAVLLRFASPPDVAMPLWAANRLLGSVAAAAAATLPMARAAVLLKVNEPPTAELFAANVATLFADSRTTFPLRVRGTQARGSDRAGSGLRDAPGLNVVHIAGAGCDSLADREPAAIEIHVAVGGRDTGDGGEQIVWVDRGSGCGDGADHQRIGAVVKCRSAAGERVADCPRGDIIGIFENRAAAGVRSAQAGGSDDAGGGLGEIAGFDQTAHCRRRRRWHC